MLPGVISLWTMMLPGMTVTWGDQSVNYDVTRCDCDLRRSVCELWCYQAWSVCELWCYQAWLWLEKISLWTMMLPGVTDVEIAHWLVVTHFTKIWTITVIKYYLTIIPILFIIHTCDICLPWHRFCFLLHHFGTLSGFLYIREFSQKCNCKWCTVRVPGMCCNNNINNNNNNNGFV